MPYYTDVPYYYGGAYANHSSLMTGTGRPFAPLSRYSPHLSTISESPLNHLHRFSPIATTRHVRRVIDTANIDVSSPRILSHDGNRPGNRLRRDRPTIKIRSQALKDNPAIREHYERHEKSVGELLMEKFLIKDKKSENEGQQTRLYHQVSLDRDEDADEDREAIQKRVTRRFTRRRSSTDLQLDPEQLQREAAYAQVQAKVLDSLVAEEQAQIENETRCGTLIRKGTTGRGPTTVPYYANNTDSDVMTKEEEDEAALRMRRALKKVKKKKKQTDKPSPPEHKVADGLDNRRFSSSSEMSTDSKIEEEEEEEEEKEDTEEKGLRPQMYKIEACNSAGDFSTIWVNAVENEKRKSNVEQFRESVKMPIPKKLGSGADALPKSTDEAEMRIVLPVRKPYVKDPSRNSVYLTMRKPTDKLAEKLEIIAREDGDRHLANGFVDAKDETPKDNSVENLTKASETSEDSSKLNGEIKTGDNIENVALKKTTDKPKKTEPSAKKDLTSKKHLDNDDSRYKRDTVILKTKNEVEVDVKDIQKPPKNIEATVNSVQSDASVFASTNAQVKQVGPFKDTLAANAKRNEGCKKDVAALDASKKRPETVATIKTPEAKEDSVSPRKGRLANKEEEGAVDTPKIPTMSYEDVTTRRSVVSVAGDANENSASAMHTPGATGQPKPSKINADRNNAVEAPELSLREAAYLANAPKCERVEDTAASSLPGKKVDKAASCLAKNASSTLDATRRTNGVETIGSALVNDAKTPEDEDAARLDRSSETTLPEGANSEVRSNDREIAKSTTDDKPAKEVDLTKTPRSNVPRESFLETTGSSSVPIVTETTVDVSKEANLPNSPKTDVKEISVTDTEKDPSRDSGLSSLKSKVPKLNAVESKSPFKPKTAKTAVNETSNADSSKIGKGTIVPKTTRNDNAKPAPAAKKDVNVPRILKKSTSVDSSKSASDSSSSLALSNAKIPKVLQQSVSVDEKATGKKSMPVKKTLEITKSKVTEKKPLLLEEKCCEKPLEETGQLSKSASTESIDFWSQIKAPDSPRVTRSKQQSGFSREAPPVVSKNEEKADLTSPKWISSDQSSGKSSTEPVKEIQDDKKNETDVKISAAPGSSAVRSGDVAEGKTPKEKAVPESPRTKINATKPAATEVEKSALTVQKVPRKKKNLSLTIDSKDSNSTVKKAPLKREDSSSSVSQSDPSTPSTVTPVLEVPTPAPEVPVINIVEAPQQPASETTTGVDEEHEDPSTPTNELPAPTLTKISKWSNRDDLTNADDAETPVPSEETSLTASPTASPQSSKTKRVIKKKKAPSKKTTSVKTEKDTRQTGNESATKALKPAADKQHLAKPSPKTSPKSSPKNAPTQRPLDLIKMFYTTPSALLTATPRDLSKVCRAKIKRRKHHSRTPSVSSDSTGSTTSTATTESTDGSTCTELDDDAEHKRMNSTRSNDSGFDGSPRISNCDMACHKKCEKLTGNLCGLNQKLVAEALQSLKRAPSQSSTDNQRNSDSSDHFSSGRITPPATNLPRFKKYAVTDFNFLKVLGKGSFGKVLLAELRGTECVYAVKCLKKDVVLEDDDVECTLIERKVLTLATRHPYLCHLFCTFQTDSHLFFVMEYLNGGDLMFHIQKSGRFPEARARFYAAEIWSGLNFLHKKGIVYRDLKLDNVLLDFEGHIRIADFGMCKLQIFLDRTADTFCGTPDYMAPEIIKGLKYNQSVDWWSFGVLLYEMLTGQSPFSGCDEDELFWSICNERPFVPRYLSQEATDMLVCLLEKDSGKRPPGHEIAMHAFFQHLPWDRLERRQLEPPFKPALDHTLDTRYFDTAFTTERPKLTPVPEQILTSMDQGVFRGFSYTNPNATD